MPEWLSFTVEKKIEEETQSPQKCHCALNHYPAKPSITKHITFVKKRKKNFWNFSAGEGLLEQRGGNRAGGWLTSAMFLQTEWLGSLLPWQQTTWLGVLDCLRQGAARHGVSVPLCTFQNLVLVSLLKVFWWPRIRHTHTRTHALLCN